MPSRTTRISLLGRIAVDRPGSAQQAALPGRRSELVFAMLAAEHRRIVSRDELADALWPTVLPDTWAPALRGVVSDVRRFLERAGLDAGELLVRAGGGYQLRLPPGVVVDVDEARAALALAREQLGAGDERGATASVQRAGELARLPFLPYHEGAWVDEVRAELEAIHIRALELEVQAQRSAGDPRAAAAAAERLVRAEPFSEAAHRLRIELLADTGDRAGAVRAYEHCRALLATELGVEPSEETEATMRRAVGAAPGATRPVVRSALVVEDHDFQRHTLVAVLRRLGVETVHDAHDGDAALSLLARIPAPDVILVDVDMPGVDGVELIRRLAERSIASAVVVVSGLDRRLLDAVHAVAAELGLQVLGVLEKPPSGQALEALLADVRRAPAGASDPARRAAEQALVQPIVALATGQLTAAEVLIDPSAPLAARLRLLWTTGAELDGVDLALRVPTAGPVDGAFADAVLAQERTGGGDPRRAVLLLDDRALGAGGAAALEAVARLRAKGFGVWLDGFDGTRATAARNDRVPLTGVRLAPELVTGAGADPGRARALQEALTVAAAMELPAVAAGCDAATDFEQLQRIGCGHAQGAFVGVAMPPPALAGWAADWAPPPAVEA